MDIEIRAEAVMEGRDYLALAHFMTYSKNKNSMMLNLLLLLVAVVGVYADFMVNGKMTFITIVAVLAVLVYQRRHAESAGDVVAIPVVRPVTFLLPEYSARRFVRTDKKFIGHTFRYVFNDNGVNILDAEAGTTALHAWSAILNMYETAGYFFLFLSRQNAVLIPKRCLSAEDLADFREMLRYHLESRYEVRYKEKKAK